MRRPLAAAPTKGGGALKARRPPLSVPILLGPLLMLLGLLLPLLGLLVLVLGVQIIDFSKVLHDGHTIKAQSSHNLHTIFTQSSHKL